MADMKLKVARGFKIGTRVRSIQVPEELRHKVKTGVPFVDEALGGEGCTPTMTVMVTGMPGAGKSTLLRQLAHSIHMSGHIALYNTGEESLFQAKMACERLFGVNLGDFQVGEEIMLPKVLEHLNDLDAQCIAEAKRTGKPRKRIFYLQDSMQTLDDGKYADKDGNSRGTTSKTPQHCVEAIVDWMQSKFGVCFFINQVTKSGNFVGNQTMLHAIDAHMHLSYDEKEKSDTYGCLLLEVNKNRWGCNGKTMILGMTGKGLEERGHFMKAGFANESSSSDE
jgi:DNA repair protein RadA/Sms